jgi:uncharacterized protein with PQ loop repeat
MFSEMRFDLIEGIFFTLGLYIAFARIPQVLKIVKRKSSNDISLIYWYSITAVLFPWIWYAIYRAKSISMLFIYITVVITNIITICFIHKYRK